MGLDMNDNSIYNYSQVLCVYAWFKVEVHCTNRGILLQWLNVMVKGFFKSHLVLSNKASGGQQ